jgi:hypothetical protein
VKINDLYTNLDDPVRRDGDQVAFYTRAAYEQFPFQEQLYFPIARTKLLYLDAAEHPVRPLNVIDAEFWVRLLDCSLTELVETALFFQFASSSNDGVFDFQWYQLHAYLTDLVPEARARSLMDRFFSASVADLRALCRPAPTGQERMAFNPLRTRPYVAREGGDYLAPIPPFIILRAAVPGLYYLVLDELTDDAEQASFIADLGVLFETYALDQVMQLKACGASVSPEMTYGQKKSRGATVDVIVEMDALVLLVEAKTTRMTEPGRQGDPEAIVERHQNLLTRAVDQIDRTVEAARAGDVAIATDRPMFGVVLTLEPYYYIATNLLPTPRVPTTIATIEDYERLVAMALAGIDLEPLIQAAIQGTGYWNLEDVVAQENGARNPLLDAAYQDVAGFGGKLDAIGRKLDESP